MDQVKIGKFIAECRKEKHLTQAQLAEKMGVTDRAVSKWETGRSMPDSSIMLELCDEIGITVNDLLNGRRIDMENYKEIAEQTMFEMRKQEETANRKLLNAEIFMGTIAVVSSMLMIFVGCAVAESHSVLGIILCIVGGLELFGSAFYGIKIERDAGYYECPECGERYVPTYAAVCFAPHFGTTRKMTCPKCGKRAYQKKVLTKD